MKHNSENAYRKWIYITLVDFRVGYFLEKENWFLHHQPPPVNSNKTNWVPLHD